MRRSGRLGGALVAAFVIMGVLGGPNALAAKAKSSTAQSAMFATGPASSSSFIVEGTETWAFDAAAAAAYFTNQWDGNSPTVSCTGGGAGGVNCLPANQPAAPSTPAASPQKLTPVVNSNQCTFWAGGAPSVSGPQSSYTQSETIGGLNGSGNWKFTWTFAIASLGPVAPRTAWNLQSSDLSPAVYTLDGFLAAQSTVKKSATRAQQWTFKTSHTIRNPDGSPRVANLMASLYDTMGTATIADDVLLDAAALTFTVETGVDFFYSRNAGASGTLNQLVDGAFVDAIQDGLVASPGGFTDDFSGNDATLGERAVIDPVDFELTSEGSFRVAVTGVLKGVDGGLNLPFATSSTVTVTAGTCA